MRKSSDFRACDEIHFSTPGQGRIREMNFIDTDFGPARPNAPFGSSYEFRVKNRVVGVYSQKLDEFLEAPLFI